MKLGLRLKRVVLMILAAGAADFARTADAVGQPDRSPVASTPPWKRQLGGDAASRVEKLERQIAQLRRESRFTEAIGPAREVAEMALAHRVEDEVEAAYRRGDLFEKRRGLMTAWGKYCDSKPPRLKQRSTIITTIGTR